MKRLVLGLLISSISMLPFADNVVQALSRAIDLPYSGDNLLSNITCLKAIERHQACLNLYEIVTKTSPLKKVVNQGL